MATIRQIEANKRNAARSTGPRTIQGKARSRMNALRHGLSSNGYDIDKADRMGDQAILHNTEGLQLVRAVRCAMVAEVEKFLVSHNMEGVDRAVKRIAATLRYENRLYAENRRQQRKSQLKPEKLQNEPN